MFRAESERVVLEQWPESAGDEMEFRLVLRGHLPPDKRGTVDAKQRIRRELHPQLQALWRQHPALRGFWDTPRGLPRIDDFSKQYERCGWRFVPLVNDAARVACSLDFLVLRREEPHRLFSGAGDLDGRIKTLIDGLRMPRQCSELNGETPSVDETPFFCLLEDDKLIYDFTVTTDRLLVPPEPNEPQRDIVAIIGVRVKSTSGHAITIYDAGF